MTKAELIANFKTEQTQRFEKRYFLGGCDPWISVMDRNVYKGLPWYRRFFGPPDEAIVAGGHISERARLKKLCDDLNGANS